MAEICNFFNTVNIAIGSETFTTLLKCGPVTIERIQSNHTSSPPGFWYDQENDEWVILLKGTAILSLENGESVTLANGDHFFIPKHQKHRVEKTSEDALWLAVHIDH